MRELLSVAAVAVTLVAGAQGAMATPFTGPLSPYYLDNLELGTIHVVQGTNVINSFPWAYGTQVNVQEGNLAVTGVVSTRNLGYGTSKPGTAGQYTLAGTPTGTSWSSNPPVPGRAESNTYDGTSDGQHNYGVEYYGLSGNGYSEDVIQFDLNWQNPVVLFSVQSSLGVCCEYLGITYDPLNNSLWIGGWNGTTLISDYTLSGSLLSSFTSVSSTFFQGYNGALAFDPADGTLWLSDGQSNILQQYSTSGVLLQSGTPTGLPSCCYLAGEFAVGSASVPAPASLLLLGIGLIGIGFFPRLKTT